MEGGAPEPIVIHGVMGPLQEGLWPQAKPFIRPYNSIYNDWLGAHPVVELHLACHDASWGNQVTEADQQIDESIDILGKSKSISTEKKKSTGTWFE